MTAKEYLEQAYWLDKRINSKLEQLESVKTMATKSTSVMGGPVVSHSRKVDSMEDAIMKIIELENEINSDIDSLVDLKKEIVHAIDAVNNPELRTLLELRYLCFKSWEAIAREMEFNVRHVYRLHGEALKKVVVPKPVQTS